MIINEKVVEYFVRIVVSAHYRENGLVLVPGRRIWLRLRHDSIKRCKSKTYLKESHLKKCQYFENYIHLVKFKSFNNNNIIIFKSIINTVSQLYKNYFWRKPHIFWILPKCIQDYIGVHRLADHLGKRNTIPKLFNPYLYIGLNMIRLGESPSH